MTLLSEPVASPDEVYEIERACAEHDRPDTPAVSRSAFAAGLATPPAGYRAEHHVARLDGVPVGYLELLFPQADNLGNVEVELMVLPSARRRGVGRALHAVAVERARADGRVRLLGLSVQRHPDGSAFAATIGAKAVHEELRSRLDLRTCDQDRLDALLAEAWRKATGYRLMQWTGVPPDAIIDEVAALDSTFMDEAPTGDLEWEAERIDADRVRAAEERQAGRGRITFHTAALYRDHVVGWTLLNCAADGDPFAKQNVTLVAPGHRGHRLGQLVKLANLARARTHYPGLQVIDTFNAASNEHMLRINREMGYRAVESRIFWQQGV